MPDHPPTQRFTPASPGDRILIAFLPCIGCGYDLRSMALHTRCPECARPAVDSLSSLHAADRRDIIALISGLRLLFWPAVVCPIFAAGMVGIDIYYQTDGPRLTLLGLLACAVIGPTIAAVGALRLAAPLRPTPGLDALHPAPLLPSAPFLKPLAISYAVCSSISGLLFALALLDAPHREPPELLLWIVASFALIAGCSWGLRNLVITSRAAHICAISNRPGLRRLSGFASYIAAASILVFLGYALFALVARFDAIPQSLFARAGSMFFVFLFFQIVFFVINGGGIAWLFGWPAGLATLARHLTPIAGRPLGSVHALIGVHEDPDAQPTPTEPRAQASDALA